MSNTVNLVKRVLVGRPMSSDTLGETLLPKRIALPVFASDPLSSVAYATEEILKVLTLGALAYLYLTPWIALAVVCLLTVVVISYRQVVHAYPGGGGSYEVVSQNLGASAGMVVAAALMVDYVMTVAVSVAAGVDNIISAVPGLHTHRVLLAVGMVVLLTAMNLRGVRESGTAFALPTYLFIAGIMMMIIWGLGSALFGHTPVAESADYTIRAEHAGLTGLGLLFLALRAFSSGCTALTGVEAISNGVPAFRPPKARNAARTMAAMGIIAITMFVGITVLAVVARVKVVEHPCDIVNFPGDCTAEPQRTVIAQLASAIFGGVHSPLFYYVQATTALVLVMAANTAYNGFPMLTSILAKHRLMPRQLRNRGDRLAFSNGIVMLALIAGALLVAYQASVTRLIQLYILGVFTSFTLSQIGMVRHWNGDLARVTAPGVRRQIMVARSINAVGAVLTGMVLVIVMITKFTGGAYLVVIAVPILVVMMRGIARHYDRVARELRAQPRGSRLPSRVHAVVLVSTMHQPTIRALAYARATRPSTLTALTVRVDPDETEALTREWIAADLPVRLTILDSPYREITEPIIDYIASIRRESPRDLVAVFVPEYVVGRWWEELLHNQSALRLKVRLRLRGGVMVTSVPYLLDAVGEDEELATGQTTQTAQTASPLSVTTASPVSGTAHHPSTPEQTAESAQPADTSPAGERTPVVTR
ncbi:MAG: APC family permease [Kineosporiaceae bacterium]|nr:APC family permease [Kineosporiaceae bacterium]